MRIVLDTAILIRGHGGARSLARDLLLEIIESGHVLLLSEAILYELARVLRYPRMRKLSELSEERVYDYVGFLREFGQIVVPNPLVLTPIRDVNDVVVMQTAVVGGADVLCTHDRDFFEMPAEGFLRRAGIEVMNDISLIQRLRERKQ